MAIRTELNLRLPNSPGALAAVCRTLADERVNILAMTVEATGQLRLVVDNHVRAAGVLRDRHHQVGQREVLVATVGGGPGALAPLLQLAADAGVNVEYAYGTTAGDGLGGAAIVLGVNDAARAAAVAGI
jgi:hypothetical protein